MKLIYITGNGHSGTTLLDYLISAHSDVFSLGEIYNLPDFVNADISKRRGIRCACESEIKNCEFWQQTESKLKEKSDIKFSDLNLQGRDLNNFSHHNLSLLKAIAETSGNTVFVDSSKSLPRLVALIKTFSKGQNETQLYIIHLVRDPKGQIASALRKSYTRNIFDAIIKYNKNVAANVIFMARTKHITVSYERLTDAPQQELERIMSFVGSKYSPEQLSWNEKQHHTIGGNGSVRFAQQDNIKKDERWKTELSRTKCILINVLCFPSILYCKLTASKPRI